MDAYFRFRHLMLLQELGRGVGGHETCAIAKIAKRKPFRAIDLEVERRVHQFLLGCVSTSMHPGSKSLVRQFKETHTTLILRSMYTLDHKYVYNSYGHKSYKKNDNTQYIIYICVILLEDMLYVKIFLHTICVAIPAYARKHSTN